MLLEHTLAAHLGKRLGRPIALCLTRQALEPERLDSIERERFERFAQPGRRLDYLRGRRALRELGPMRRHSLSHSTPWAVAAGCEHGAIGVDLEIAPRELQRALPLFLHAHERLVCANDKDATRLWTIKEAVFKAGTSEDWFAGVDVVHPSETTGHAVWQGRGYRYACTPFESGWLTVAIGLEEIS